MIVELVHAPDGGLLPTLRLAPALVLAVEVDFALAIAVALGLGFVIGLTPALALALAPTLTLAIAPTLTLALALTLTLAIAVTTTPKLGRALTLAITLHSLFVVVLALALGLACASQSQLPIVLCRAVQHVPIPAMHLNAACTQWLCRVFRYDLKRCTGWPAMPRVRFRDRLRTELQLGLAPVLELRVRSGFYSERIGPVSFFGIGLPFFFLHIKYAKIMAYF